MVKKTEKPKLTTKAIKEFAEKERQEIDRWLHKEHKAGEKIYDMSHQTMRDYLILIIQISIATVGFSIPFAQSLVHQKILYYVGIIVLLHVTWSALDFLSVVIKNANKASFDQLKIEQSYLKLLRGMTSVLLSEPSMKNYRAYREKSVELDNVQEKRRKTINKHYGITNPNYFKWEFEAGLVLVFLSLLKLPI